MRQPDDDDEADFFPPRFTSENFKIFLMFERIGHNMVRGGDLFFFCINKTFKGIYLQIFSLVRIIIQSTNLIELVQKQIT